MSYTNNYLISILIITTVYLLNIPKACSELSYICLPNNKPFTNNYGESRAVLGIDAIAKAASNQGFVNASDYRFNKSGEWAYGLALCRGGIPAKDCTRCVEDASFTLINTHCPDSRSSIIWCEYCMVKYSDVDFFGIVDTNSSSMYNTTGDTWDSQGIQTVIAEELVSNYLIHVFINSSQNLYGTSNLIAFDNKTTVTLYGMAQCTRDLVKADCTECLDQALNDLKATNFSRYKGVRMLYGSCILGYEIYPF